MHRSGSARGAIAALPPSRPAAPRFSPPSAKGLLHGESCLQVLRGEATEDQRDAQVAVSTDTAALADDLIARRRCRGGKARQICLDLVAQRQVGRELEVGG